MNLVSRKEAVASGSRYYCTGKPCKRGHLSDRLVINRQCAECSASRERNKQTQTEYYSRPDIKAARKAYMKEYWQRRKPNLSDKEIDGLREATKRWRSNNLDLVRERDRKYAARRKEQRQAYAKEYQRKFPEKSAAKERNKRARVRKNGGTHTVQDVADILKMQRGRCAYCRKNVGNKYHVDHIIPIVKSGRNDRSNLQILCPTCNHRKHSKDPIDFAQSMGRLL